MPLGLDDTIAAVATPGARGGIGIVRISGPEALAVGRRVFDGWPSDPTPRYLYHGRIVHPSGGHPLDEALAVWMAAPRSYTGDDTVELHCHGGALNLERILAAVLACGARLAGPGEFTRRAYLNGRIDLTQAEAVLDVLEARCEAGLDAAQAQLAGALRAEVEALRARLTRVRADLEVALDFVDEDVPLIDRAGCVGQLDEAAGRMRALAQTWAQGRRLREGVLVVVAGPPNAGKSSLFNALVGSRRAIVTTRPGTTRDYLEESLQLGGLPVVLVDTAGLRVGDDEAERIGVERSLDQLRRADVVLCVHDASRAPSAADDQVHELVEPARRIEVHNKLDRGRAEGWPRPESPTCVATSATQRQGIDALVAALRQRVARESVEGARGGGIVVTRARHHAALRRGSEAADRAAQALREALPLEVVAAEVQLALEALADLVGETSPDDVLDVIFSEFCIGK